MIGVTPHGASFWTQTARLATKLPGGAEQSYFLKVALGEHGMRMMHGEFESMTALHSAVPHFTPKPYGWGSYRDIPDMHFFLCEFRYVSELRRGHSDGLVLILSLTQGYGRRAA